MLYLILRYIHIHSFQELIGIVFADKLCSISLLEHIPTSVDIAPCLFVASDSTKFTISFRVATV